MATNKTSKSSSTNKTYKARVATPKKTQVRKKTYKARLKK